MDLFALDKIVVEFVQRLINDPAYLFGFMAGLGALANGLFPDKSKSGKGNKK
jgi:hypothetical protein